jgi:MoaA/NifB/PqqE/SkfB family radical SAM enzyme
MPIKGLVMYYTMRCVASCAHCGVWSGPDRRERMTLARASRYLTDVAEHCQPKVVVFVGGEPMLHPDDICELIRLGRSLGIVTQLSTNAFWASTDDRARSTLARLADAGLDHLALSADSYHSEFVDPQNVGRALRIAREFGLVRKLQVIRSVQNDEGATLLEAAGIDPDEVVDHLVFKVHRNDPTFDARRWVILNRHSVTPFGRAAFLEEHAVLHPMEELEDIGCLMAGRFPIVYPNGDLYSCCCTAGFYKEFLVGNLDRDGIAELEDRLSGDTVLDAINRTGPVALAREVVATGVDVGERFATSCHLCRQLLANTDRKALEEHAGKLVLLDMLFGDPVARERFEDLV